MFAQTFAQTFQLKLHHSVIFVLFCCTFRWTSPLSHFTAHPLYVWWINQTQEFGGFRFRFYKLSTIATLIKAPVNSHPWIPIVYLVIVPSPDSPAPFLFRSWRPWPDTPARWIRRCSLTSPWCCWPLGCSSPHGSLCILSNVETPVIPPPSGHLQNSVWRDYTVCRKEHIFNVIIISVNKSWAIIQYNHLSSLNGIISSWTYRDTQF